MAGETRKGCCSRRRGHIGWTVREYIHMMRDIWKINGLVVIVIYVVYSVLCSMYSTVTHNHHQHYAPLFHYLRFF